MHEYSTYKTQPHSDRHERFRNLCRRVFRLNKDGEELMGMLEDDFIKAPVAPYEQPEAYCRHREGQNSLIRIMKQAAEIPQTEIKANE